MGAGRVPAQSCCSLFTITAVLALICVALCSSPLILRTCLFVCLFVCFVSFRSVSFFFSSFRTGRTICRPWLPVVPGTDRHAGHHR